MEATEIQRLSDAIRDVHDFPKPGIVFKDITPVLGDGELFELTIRALAETAGGVKIDKIVGIDARGFIFGAAVAHLLGAGFVPIRKKGKLPWATEIESYSLEYGEAEIEIHKDAIVADEKILVIDDLLATGGTAAAALKLIDRIGGEVIAVSFLIELAFLNGRERLGGAPVKAILTY
jgi:adenine phosphoribosyltransferase